MPSPAAVLLSQEAAAEAAPSCGRPPDQGTGAAGLPAYPETAGSARRAGRTPARRAGESASLEHTTFGPRSEQVGILWYIKEVHESKESTAGVALQACAWRGATGDATGRRAWLCGAFRRSSRRSKARARWWPEARHAAFRARRAAGSTAGAFSPVHRATRSATCRAASASMAPRRAPQGGRHRAGRRDAGCGAVAEVATSALLRLRVCEFEGWGYTMLAVLIRLDAREHLFQPAWLMRWYIVTLVLSIEVQKDKISKPQTKQTVAMSPPIPPPRGSVPGQ